MITITESAQEYLAELLEKQEDALGVRVFINQPGTPRAETCIAYCRDGDIQEGDEEQALAHFTVWYEGRSLPFLEDALVDYAKDRMGGQLTIKAPNAKMPRVDDDSPMEDRINYVLYNEVNPALAAHGGEVSLVEITEEQVAAIRTPVLAVIGSQDPLKVGVDAMQGLLPNLEVLVLDGADHMTATMSLVHANAFAGRMLEFLGEKGKALAPVPATSER